MFLIKEFDINLRITLVYKKKKKEKKRKMKEKKERYNLFTSVVVSTFVNL